jgi:hypothetical protein
LLKIIENCESVKVLFCPVLPDIQKNTEGSQASPACFSDKYSIRIKMSMELWWNDTQRGKAKYSDKNLDKSPVSNLGLRGERPATNRLSLGTSNNA